MEASSGSVYSLGRRKARFAPLRLPGTGTPRAARTRRLRTPHPTLVLGAILATAPATGLALDGAARAQLAHAVATALTGSAVLLALGLAVVAAAVRRPRPVPTPRSLEVAR